MVKLPNVKNLILNLFPILQWSRTYNVEKGVGDLIAGITIALTLIPQSMAYALLAGFEPQIGLYGSFMGGFVYAIMGKCPQISIGPAALTALLTFTYTNGTNIDFGVFFCFVTGVAQVIAGVMQLGFLVEFVSIPVVSGFTSAAAFTISSSQLKGLLGLKFKSSSFVGAWKCLFQQIGETSLPDTLLSVVCCATLVGMRCLKNIRIKQPADKAGQRKAKIKAKSLWLLSVARNAVVVSLATILAACIHVEVDKPLHVTGPITPGVPSPRPPPFKTTLEDKVYTATDMLAYFGSGLILLPLVGILTNVAIVKAFAKDQQMDATQEIIALGVCNIGCSFFKSMPISGSLSRGAVGNASGVRTPAAGLCTGVLVILTLLLLTPYFYYIPRAALASVIVCAVLCMVDITTVRKLWKSSKIDLLPLSGTFFCCLAFGTEIGLICGVIIDIMLILYYNSRPPLDADYVDNGVLPAHYAIYPVGHLHFAGAEKVRSRLLSLKQDYNAGVGLSQKAVPDVDTKDTTEATTARPTPPLVVYCDAVHRMDYTFLQTIKLLVSDWSRTGRVIWCNTRPTVRSQLTETLEKPIFCESAQLQACFTSNVADIADSSSAASSAPGPSHRAK